MNSEPQFKRIALIGFGLIGGSIARAARAQGLVGDIVTTAHSAKTRARVAELGIVLQLAFFVDDRPAVCFELHDVTVPPADDVAGFSVEIPPGTRVVEASSVFDYLEIPRPVRAAWTAGKAGLAGASAVAGWLKGTHGERADQEPGS